MIVCLPRNQPQKSFLNLDAKQIRNAGYGWETLVCSSRSVENVLIWIILAEMSKLYRFTCNHIKPIDLSILFSKFYIHINQIKLTTMQNSQDYTSVYLQSNDIEHESRSSSEPINPPSSAKLKPYNSSINSSSSYQEEGYTEDLVIKALKNNDNEEKTKPTFKERCSIFLSYARPMFVMLFFDVGLPLAIYYILKIWLSVLVSLILSGIPPLLRVFYVFWKKRHIDVLGCVFVFSFVLSAVLSIISGKFDI